MYCVLILLTIQPNLYYSFFTGTPLHVTFALHMKNYFQLSSATGQEANWFLRDLKSNNHGIFNKSLHIKYERYFYDYLKEVRRVGDVEKLPREVLCLSAALHLGLSSTVYGLTTVDHTVTAKPQLFTLSCQHVEVDMATRRPSSNKAVLGVDEGDYPKLDPPPRYKFPDRPTSANMETRDYVTEDVIDTNKHATVTTYVAVFMKTVADNLKNRKYKTIKERDHNKLHIKEFLMVYHRESLLGDVMETYTWEDDVTPGCIHGEVRRSNILLAQCILLCFSSDIRKTNANL